MFAHVSSSTNVQGVQSTPILSSSQIEMKIFLQIVPLIIIATGPRLETSTDFFLFLN